MLQRTPLSEDLHPLIHDLIRDEGPHIISPQLIDKIISVADIVQINNGQPLIESGSVNPDFFILLYKSLIEEDLNSLRYSLQ